MDKIDWGAVYFGEDIAITPKIRIRQMTLGEIRAFGESAYFSAVSLWTTIPDDAKSLLEDAGIDYAQLSDFEYFIKLSRSAEERACDAIISGFNPARAVLMQNTQNGELVLVDKQSGAAVDRLVHQRIAQVLCQMHGIEKEREIACNTMAREFLIDEDRQMRREREKRPSESVLATWVSALAGRTGLQGNMAQIMGMTIYQVRDAIKRLTMIERADSLTRGICLGLVDAKKIDTKQLDWARAIPLCGS